MRIDLLQQGLDFAKAFFVDANGTVLPPKEMTRKSRSVDFYDLVLSAYKYVSKDALGYVNFLEQNSLFVVSGPLRDNYVGLYAGIVCGYDSNNDQLEVVYMNPDEDVWTDNIKVDDDVSYKWGIMKRPE